MKQLVASGRIRLAVATGLSVVFALQYLIISLFQAFQKGVFALMAGFY
jgi:hypothetical protein